MRSTEMYYAIGILFLIPCSILWVAWSGTLKNAKEFAHSDWRSYCLRASLVVATIATLTAMAISLSWTHSGGSPHGLMPKPGLWLTLRPVAKWSVVATIVLGAFGKGRGRLLAIGSTISIFFVIWLLAVLEMD